MLMTLGQECPQTDEELTGLAGLEKSIERSRKRHLSVGLLRGDLVQDRLKLQEEASSPLLKKSRPSPTPALSPEVGFDSTLEPYLSPGESPAQVAESDNMALTMAEFKAYMDANTNKALADTNTKLEVVDKSLSGMKRTVNEIESTVKNNSARLNSQADSIQANNAEIKRIH